MRHKMVRIVDAKERENEVLGLVVDSYVEGSKPVSSSYLCQKYNLNCSSATIRNVMLSLEKQGLLAHVHTSSGKVPTKEGFKRYIENIKKKEEAPKEDYALTLKFYSLPVLNINEIINYTLDSLVEHSGYTSLMAISGENEKFIYRGMRYMLEQPEFGNISRLKDIIYALEVRMQELGSLLFDCISDKVQILIGDDIGFQEIADCSLIVSGVRSKQLDMAFALLGPMRMNYTKASSCLDSVRSQLSEVVEELV